MEGGFRNPILGEANIGDGAVTSLKLAATLQSDNYVAGTSGWQINRDTGNAEFQDVTVRGTIEATAGSIEGTLSMGGSGRIEFERGTSAVISTNDNPQSGDVWIEYRGNDAGAIIGLRDFGGGTQLVVAQLEVTADGFDVTQGQFLIGSGTAGLPALGFGIDNDTGLFRYTSNSIAFTTAGSVAMQLGTTNVNFPTFDTAPTGSASIRHTGIDASNPPFTFVGDGDTGMYRHAADTIAFVTGGSGPDVLITPSGAFQARFNDASTPAFGFHSDSDTGLYRNGTNQLGISAGGARRMFIGTGNVGLDTPTTTTNSGLAAWRHNNFAGSGGVTYDFLPLISTAAMKRGIRDITPRKAWHYVNLYRPREWKSKAKADPKNVWLPGFVVEESPKTPRDLISPLVTIVKEQQKEIDDLKQRLAKVEQATTLGVAA